MINLEEKVREIIERRTNEVNDFFDTHVIAIGIIDNSSSERTEEKIKLNNAQILRIHEYGSLDGRIPKRPVLKLTILYTKFQLLPQTMNNIKKIIFSSKYSIDKIEKELNILCRRMQQYARDLIAKNDGTFVDNAISTQIAKGKKVDKKAKPPIRVNHPLFDTGQLSRAIKCALLKK